MKHYKGTIKVVSLYEVDILVDDLEQAKTVAHRLCEFWPPLRTNMRTVNITHKETVAHPTLEDK